MSIAGGVLEISVGLNFFAAEEGMICLGLLEFGAGEGGRGEGGIGFSLCWVG